MVAGALVVTLSQVLLPQGAALAVQNTVLPSPGQSISVAFAPQSEKPHIAATGGDFTGRLVSLQTTPVYLPLRLTGIAPDLMLVAENIFVTFTAPGGQSENVPLTDNNPLPLHVPGQADDTPPLYQIVWVPNEFYRAHAGQKLRVDITFALGIARPGTSYKLAAMGGNLRTPEGLWCATRLNIERSVGLNCMKPSNVRLRVSAALVDQTGASRNPVQVSYSPSDAPSYGGLVAISRLSLSMPLRDIHTGDRYPVSSQNVSTAKIAVTLNQPLTHIARKVTIEDFRLSDWKADITGKAP
jgi:hypothetical protein